MNSYYNVPERFLRQLWKNRQFSNINLKTTENQSVEIISEGKLNQNSGPDFLNAAVRINGILYRGDIEIHQRNEEWFEHKHHKDAKYNSVILHVVFFSKLNSPLPITQSKRLVPVLALENYLTSYGESLERMILDERVERLAKIKCYDLNDSVDASQIIKWLEKLAIERIELKVRRFDERLKELIEEDHLQIKEPPSRYDYVPFGINPEDLPPPSQKYTQADFRKGRYWEQILYEGIMEALGYSKNQESFLRLARNVRLKFFFDNIATKSLDDPITHIESILFSTAGLIPKPHKDMDKESIKKIQLLRQCWQQYRDKYRGEILSATDWHFFRSRPENFPTIRIAGAAQLIKRFLQKNALKFIIQTVKSSEKNNNEKITQLEQIFNISSEGFWTKHFRFGKISKKSLKALIGKNRSNEIVINVIIPLCLLYARIFKDKDVREATLKLFRQYPISTENSIAKIISTQLLKVKTKLNSAMHQQGAIQLYKFYCAEEKCSECSIGKTVF